MKNNSWTDASTEETIAPRLTLGQMMGDKPEEEFGRFDLSEVQKVLTRLSDTDAIDLAHAETLQQQALRGADIISEYLGKVIKTVSYLETKINSAKNKVALNYQAPDGVRTTADMKKQAGESSPEVEELSYRLGSAKGSKSLLEKKYDILIRSHHHYKDIAAGMKRSMVGSGYGQNTEKKAITGWE